SDRDWSSDVCSSDLEDVTERAGVGDHHYGCSLAVGDIDNDGDIDLYVTNYGPNVLYLNNGNGTFTDVTEEAGVTCRSWSSSAARSEERRVGKECRCR